MAVNYSDLTPGTPLTWKASGGDKTMTLTSLATAGMREGAKSATFVDGTKGFPELLEITAEVKVGSAPTDGLEVEIYLGFSSNSSPTSDNPGGLTGSDAAVADVDQLPQLTFVGSIIMAGSLGTGTQRQRFTCVPQAEYLIPVLRNASGQTTSATASDNVITIRPWYRRTPVA